MDPLLIVFGFGVGVLVGMTGMGGGSLMTPLLVLLFGVTPTIAVASDIAYQAITKTVGGWRHFKLRTVNFDMVKWLAIGSVPGAISGVYVIHLMERLWGDSVQTFTLIALGVVLALTGGFTLVRSLLVPKLEDDAKQGHVNLDRMHRFLAVMIGVTTGFVIGITSAGSGTLIAVALIAIFNLSPRNVVGTDVFHAAILLWAAGFAHWVGGGIDFVLVGTLLLGSIPGVILGAKFSVKVPIGALRTALGMVLVASGSATLAKADIPFAPLMLVSTMGIFLVGFVISVLIGKKQNPWAISTTPSEGAPQAASSQ